MVWFVHCAVINVKQGLGILEICKLLMMKSAADTIQI